MAGETSVESTRTPCRTSHNASSPVPQFISSTRDPGANRAAHRAHTALRIIAPIGVAVKWLS